MKKRCKKQNRIFGALGSASGGGAVASAHNVCHTLCVSLAALLATFGIIISDTALMFLQDYNIYFWLMGLFFLIVSLILLIKDKPVSVKLMIFNAGLLIASAPFYQNAISIITGASVSLYIIAIFAVEKTEVMIWKKK